MELYTRHKDVEHVYNKLKGIDGKPLNAEASLYGLGIDKAVKRLSRHILAAGARLRYSTVLLTVNKVLFSFNFYLAENIT